MYVDAAYCTYVGEGNPKCGEETAMSESTSSDDGRTDKAAGEGPGATRSQLTLAEELRDSISSRTWVMVIGVLFLQLGFILSYVGAFHSPTPVHLPVGIVAPATIGSEVATKINAIAGQPLSAHVVVNTTTARKQIKNATLDAALVVDTTSSTDTLLVASAAGSSLLSSVETVATAAEAQLHRSVTVVDVVPLQKGDGHGLTGFYLVIGWIVGGYLCAAMFGISGGAKPATFRRTIIRLSALLLYAIASGLGGVIIVGPVLGALTGHLVALWWLGALLVFTAGAVTLAFQGLLGVIGIGLTVLVFVVLGNPSAGGAYQAGVLPPFWRAIGNALPNGAGVDSVRRIVYFGAEGIGGHLLVVFLYAVGGTVIALLAAFRKEGRSRVPNSDSPAQLPAS
jgi:hypothetical protein